LKKILLGVFLIALTVGLVSGAAYAAFQDTIDVTGIAITTGNADLDINGDEGIASLKVDNIYPNWQDGQLFYLSNESLSAIGLDITATLTGKSGWWTGLKDKMYVRVIEYSSEGNATWDLGDHIAGNNGAITHDTGWKTLAEWDINTYLLSGSAIAPTNDRYYVVWGWIVNTAGNEIASKTVNLSYRIYGTQHL
jgi:hypothetical protein